MVLKMKTKFTNKKLLWGAGLFVLLFLVLVILPSFYPKDPYTMDVPNRLKPPSSMNFFGTDEHGRDVFARVIHGGRISILIAVLVTFLSMVFGTIIGLYSSTNSYLDHFFMRICDGLMAIPAMLLAIALMSAFGASVKNVIIALVVVYTPMTARVVRSVALKIKSLSYIEAIKLQGASNFRILWIHIFPNTVGQLAVQASYIFASTIISEASLSFLGAGIPQPIPSWGSIIQQGKKVVIKAPWLVIIPSIMILLSVIALNLFGDGLREKLDPNSKVRLSKSKLNSLYEMARKKLKDQQK